MAIAAKAADITKRFWEKVEKRGPDECWLWTATKGKNGYGYIWTGKTMVRAHRFSWSAENGPIPYGLHVLHKCDTPSCVNPRHLFLGTQQDNTDDMMAKRRHFTGIGNSKLTPKQVMDIRANYALCRVTQVELGKRYGVGQDQISRICSGQRWRDQ